MKICIAPSGYWLGGNKLKMFLLLSPFPGGGDFRVFFVHSCLLLFFHVHVFLENCLTFSHEVLYIFSWYWTDGQHAKKTSFQRCALLQSVSKCFETFRCFTKFSFQDMWNDFWLLLINIVYTSCLTSCQTT